MMSARGIYSNSYENGGDTLKNALIKNALKEAGLAQWKLAKILGMGETTLSRKFREDLPEEEQLRIVSIIKKEAAHE